ncbi:MAG: cytochrome c biogenesis protein CcsA, partial [Bacteroidota bacterium]
MIYNGEHLLPGQIGHFLGLLSVVASLLATIFYLSVHFQPEGSADKNKWLQFARIFFFLETVSIFAIFGDLYYIISNHYHEYYYAWNHSSRSLQLRYILACFWEGSEGSFLLWSFWHCILGWIIIWKSKKFEAPVMFIISFAQFALATMVVGVYLWGHNIGTNPFILWREQMPNMPIFSNPDYLQYPRVHEGNDLNVLLQNYWMVIHPPVLFLGFASTIVPFAFAIAGMMQKTKEWVKPALPWAVFSGAVLGLGIMMGGAWAYESLSFGGYWAWDPVENASLVPWLVMIAGLHTNLVYKSTGYSLKSTYMFYIFSFTLILYSTFLTRSGILGDTSVHAFTESGMNVQLYLFLNLFVWVPTMLATNKKNIQLLIFGTFLLLNIISYYYPVITLVSMISSFVWLSILLKEHAPASTKEESNYSREFWMFIASMVFFLAGIIIIAKTSVPIYNKLFNQNVAPPEDREFEYNRIQVFIAIIIGVLTAVTQYLKYKTTNDLYFGKKVFRSTVLSIAFAAFISIKGGINYDKQGIGFLIAIHVAIFAAVYAIVANTNYILTVLKGSVKLAGASIAHVGFGMILLGILLSASKKTILSNNNTGIAVFQKSKMEDPAENVTLFKGV